MTTGTSWRIQGDIMDACNCNVTCPCNFGGDPTMGYCEAILAMRVQEGNYGATQLGGLNIVLYLRMPSKVFEGNWTLGVYLDQRANEQQVDALGTVLSGQAGGLFAVLSGLIGTALPPKQVPISFETVNGEHSISIPGLLEVGSEPIPNPMPGGPPLNTTATDLAIPFFTGTANVRRSRVFKLSDPDLSFEHTGRSSVVGRFDYSGP